jgi:CHAD domain-containing protein
MSQEREVKLAAPAAFAMPDLSGIPGIEAVSHQPVRFQTVYLDTEDLRVARWGCSLRHREGQGWTVKLPPSRDGALLVRGEHLFDGDARKVPIEATDLLTAYVRGAELRPVVRLRTIRRPVELRDAEARAVGEVVDDEVSVMDGARVAARFREVEVEVGAEVPKDALEAILDRLRQAGASPTDGTPKYLQALGARASSPPEVGAGAPSPDATVGSVIRAAIASSVVRLLEHDAGVRLGEDPEDVHQARVATRRLRSDLRTFRESLDPEWDSALRAELAWLGEELGRVRDAEVQRDRMASRVELLPEGDRPMAERLVAGIDRHREEMRTELLASMRSERYVRLLDRLVASAREPAVLPEVEDVPASTALGAVMARPWKHLTDAVDGVSEPPADTELHLVRIRTKRARYAAEAVAPIFGKRAGGFARRAAELQGILGEHQDAVVAQAWLREEAAGGARRAFVAGELAMIEREAAAVARERWRGEWKRLAQKRFRFWA